MRTYFLMVMGITILCGCQFALALDHDNLDKNRPVQVEDAYPIAKGEMALEGGFSLEDRRNADNRLDFHVAMLYGVFYNAQLEIGSSVLTDLISSREGDTSGDLSLGMLYNFNTETLNLPAMSVKVGLDYVIRDRSDDQVEMALEGILTRTFGRWRTHLNAEYILVSSNRQQGRGGLYNLIAGVNYPLGYPIRFRETLILDIFTRQSEIKEEKNVTGIELGVRHQWTPRFVLDGGIGSEVLGPSQRSPFFATLGVSLGF